MRILVVEDEEKVSRFVTRGLAAERFAVDVARDGKTGWELAQTYQYDLIILDLMLPGLTGGEVLRRIRKANSQVPVLILTARDSLGDKIEHFEAGADDYLTKPFAFAELLVRVKALFAGANLKITSGEWHELRVEAAGNKITCYYDGNKKIEATDDTFKDAGKVGLWTKADSVTYFDDLKATAR